MARSIVDELFDRLIAAFPAHRAYDSDALAADPMPAPVAHFLQQLLQHRTTHELRDAGALVTAWVDHRHPEVQRARQAYRDALVDHAQIPASEWEGALRRALQRVTAYLIHPTSTLAHFVYGDDAEALSIHDVQARMNFFSAYRYLHAAVERQLEEEAETLARDRFVRLLERADTRRAEGFEADDWLTLLQPLFDLMDVANDEQEVPTPFLHTFFAEKGAAAIAQQLQTASVQHGTTTLGPADLRTLIDGEPEPILNASEPATREAVPPSSPDTASEEPSASASASEPDATSAADSVSEDAPANSVSPTDDNQDDDQAKPLWKRFQSGPSPASPSAKPPEGEDDGTPLWQRFQPEADEDTPAEVTTTLERDVLGERGPSNRALFIRELFGGSEEDYKHTLKRLRSASNWGRASQIIAEDVFRTHQVNIYSDPAVLFTNAVEDRFRNDP